MYDIFILVENIETMRGSRKFCQGGSNFENVFFFFFFFEGKKGSKYHY